MTLFREAFEFERADDSFRSQDLMVHSVKAIFVPAGIRLKKTIRAPVTRVKSFDPRSEITWTNPLCVKFSLGIRTKNQFPRRLKLSHNQELQVSRFRCNR